MPDYWRDLPYILQNKADICKNCGYPNDPHRYFCVRCGEKCQGIMEDLPREGVIYSFIINYFTPPEIERPGISILADLGPRKLYGFLVECLPEEVFIGMPVVMVTRVIKQQQGFSYYGIKFCPRRDPA